MFLCRMGAGRLMSIHAHSTIKIFAINMPKIYAKKVDFRPQDLVGCCFFMTRVEKISINRKFFHRKIRYTAMPERPAQQRMKMHIRQGSWSFQTKVPGQELGVRYLGPADLSVFCLCKSVCVCVDFKTYFQINSC